MIDGDLQFNIFVGTVKDLCNKRCRITITHFLVLVLAGLCFVFAMKLQCFFISFQMFCNQNLRNIQTNSQKIQTEIYNSVIEDLTLCINARVSIPATLQMQGFRTSMKTCECKGFCDCFNFVYIHQFLHQLISFFTFSELLIQPLPKKIFLSQIFVC